MGIYIDADFLMPGDVVFSGDQQGRIFAYQVGPDGKLAPTSIDEAMLGAVAEERDKWIKRQAEKAAAPDAEKDAA